MTTAQKVKPNKKAIDTKALYNKAIDPLTPQDELRDMWYMTTSAKVRKAIAANPNVSPEVLKLAARLYIEEVLENPTFEVLQLFNDDPWIADISMFYDDPAHYLRMKGAYSTFQAGPSCNARTLTAYFTPKLCLNTLGIAVSKGSKTAFKRAMKSEKAKTNVLRLIHNSTEDAIMNYLGMDTLLYFHNEGLVNRDYIRNILLTRRPRSTNIKKNGFNSFVSALVKNYKAILDKPRPHGEADKAEIISSIAMVLTCANSKMTHELNSALSYAPIELVVDLFKLLPEGKGRENLFYSAYLTGLAEIIHRRHMYIGGAHFAKSSKGLEDFYAIINGNGIVDRFKKYIGNSVIQRDHDTVKALMGASKEAQEFFVSSQMYGNWAASDNPIFPVFESVNTEIFKREGITENLLYNSMSIKRVAMFKSVYVF